MHELMQFIHHSFQERPMIDEKAWELANNVHDVTRDKCFCVFGRALLAEIEKFFDDRAQELVLALDTHAA